jgi:hypothetical protein
MIYDVLMANFTAKLIGESQSAERMERDQRLDAHRLLAKLSIKERR